MKTQIVLLTLILGLMTPQLRAADAAAVRLITLDPGHFHAGLVQKFMYPGVSPEVHVYAPGGPDLQEHLKRVEGFNTRAENQTHWEEKVSTGPDFLERMVREKPGNVVVISGNNARKTEYIYDSIDAGLNVLADKPMAITPEGFALLAKAFATADRKKVLLYDIMTERHEIATILQRELAQTPAVFGKLEKGTPDDPAVVMESVHYFFKEVAGKPLIRPAWFFDVRQQGEAVPDVGTHLVDLVQWECFPKRVLNWKRDIHVYNARRWPTKMTQEEFSRVTGLAERPAYLNDQVDREGRLNVYQNGDVSYSIRGVHAKVTALWGYEAPPGAKDSHYSKLRGTRATLEIKQGPQENYQATLYVQPRNTRSADRFEAALRKTVQELARNWPGIELKRAGQQWQFVVPAKYNIGHEAHFAQVTEDYLKFLAAGRLPGWEVPNMLAKYYVTTEAYRLSHQVAP